MDDATVIRVIETGEMGQVGSGVAKIIAYT